jgi:hypothetical protein
MSYNEVRLSLAKYVVQLDNYALKCMPRFYVVLDFGTS